MERRKASTCRNIQIVLLVLILVAKAAAFQSSRNNDPKITNLVARGWLDDFISAPSKRPKVTVPDDFQTPEPQPLTLTRPSDLPSVLKSSLALALRLGTGAFVLGWKIDTLLAPDDDGKYALSLGPFRIRDSSSVLATAPRPEKPLILYEYDASPYCKRGKKITIFRATCDEFLSANFHHYYCLVIPSFK